MADFDVFNGDADGICALTQLRLSEPRSATLVTGVKRDINLLKKVTSSDGDRVTVLDVSMDKNHDDLQIYAIHNGVQIFNSTKGSLIDSYPFNIEENLYFNDEKVD